MGCPSPPDMELVRMVASGRLRGCVFELQFIFYKMLPRQS